MSDRDRDKLSFSEQDKRRREQKNGRGGGNGNGGGGGGRNRRRGRGGRWGSAAYKKRVDERLFGKKGDAGRYNSAERLRKAQGSPMFLRAYREYVREYGMPDDLSLLLLLLDLEEEGEVLKVLEALDGTAQEASVDQKNLLRKRLRNFEMSTSSDRLADAATDLLGRL